MNYCVMYARGLVYGSTEQKRWKYWEYLLGIAVDYMLEKCLYSIIFIIDTVVITWVRMDALYRREIGYTSKGSIPSRNI